MVQGRQGPSAGSVQCSRAGPHKRRAEDDENQHIAGHDMDRLSEHASCLRPELKDPLAQVLAECRPGTGKDPGPVRQSALYEEIDDPEQTEGHDEAAEQALIAPEAEEITITTAKGAAIASTRRLSLIAPSAGVGEGSVSDVMPLLRRRLRELVLFRLLVGNHGTQPPQLSHRPTPVKEHHDACLPLP